VKDVSWDTAERGTLNLAKKDSFCSDMKL
jgi:hypothetical protein